jgi:hypothetical protein
MNPDTNYTLPPRRHGRIRRAILFPLLALVAVFVLYHGLRRGGVSSTLREPQPVFVEMSDAFPPDVYPSKPSAVRALAAQLPTKIVQINDDPQELRLALGDDRALAAPISDALRRHFPRVEITESAQDNDAPSERQVVIRMTITTEPPKPPRRTPKGTVQLTLAAASRATSISTKFTECPWADDLAGYINDHPGHTWIVARSSAPCLSPGDSARVAETEAATALASLIQRQFPASAAPVSLEDSDALLLSDIRRSLPVKDRFVQRFQRPYGNVWSESILLDASPQWIEEVQRRHVYSMHTRHTRMGTIVGSTGVVLAAILVAYLFVNAVTQNYFTGRLRFAAILSAMIAVVVAIGVISIA